MDHDSDPDSEWLIHTSRDLFNMRPARIGWRQNLATTSMSATAANVSSSRTGITTTPVRAIVSTISSRSTPTIPPANQSYEPLVKNLFRHRLRLILLLSIVATWAIESVWMWWQAGGRQSLGIMGSLTCPFSPWVLVRTLVSWSAVALPVVVLRKVFLTRV
jgi:nucleoporin NDC1